MTAVTRDPERSHRWAFAALCAGQFIYLMDMFLMNVSAPQIRAEFQNTAVLQGVFAANQIAFASFVFLRTWRCTTRALASYSCWARGSAERASERLAPRPSAKVLLSKPAPC